MHHHALNTNTLKLNRRLHCITTISHPDSITQWLLEIKQVYATTYIFGARCERFFICSCFGLLVTRFHHYNDDQQHYNDQHTDALSHSV